MDKVTVQPCPFCNETPKAEFWHGGGSKKTMISCVNEACPVQPSTVASIPSKAAAQWNTRKQAEARSEEIVRELRT